MLRLGSTWIIILRCYRCGTHFSLKGVAAGGIGVAADASRCPDCGAAGAQEFPTADKHLIVKLAREREAN